MEQTVYIDIYFLINFSMDFLGLFLGVRILGRRESLWRLSLAALFGGLYACLSLIASLDAVSSMLSFALDALACIVMAFIAVFHKENRRGFLSFSLVIGAISILLGGAMTALFYVFNRLGLDEAFGGAGEQNTDGLSVWLFAIFAALSGFMAIVGGRFLRKRSMCRSGYIEIEYRKRRVRIDCICDSGNLLREPISHLPCVLVELDAVKGIFSSRLYDCVKGGSLGDSALPEANRLRMIPARGAVGAGLLVGILPDAVRLDMGKGSVAVDAYIVLSRDKISAQGAKALVPSDLVFGAA